MPRYLIRMGLAAFLLTASICPAAELDGRWGMGLEGGLMKLQGGENDYSNLDQQATLHVLRGLNSNLLLDLSLKYGWVRPGAVPGEDAGFKTSSVAPLYTVITQPQLNALYYFTPQNTFSPFVGLGAGVTYWQVRDMRGFDSVGLVPDGPTPLVQEEDGTWNHLHNTNFTASGTAGVQFFTSQSFGLNLGIRGHYLASQNLDNIGWQYLTAEPVPEPGEPARNGDPAQADRNKWLLEGFVGITFLFGSTDKDSDGIKDNEDACPGSPEDYDGYEDTDGCPDLDNDGDGVLDTQDDCPDQPEDIDGFQDEDGCPDPDNDGDGLPDAQDRCPDEAEDVDGFEDDDGCPDLDNDGDGVADTADNCPDTPAGVMVDARGCPEVEEITATLTLLGVNFVTGSAELTPTSMAVLEEVARSLVAYPEVRIEVRGHTDSSGSAEVNRKLSQERADSVRNALMSLGVTGDRMTAVGYGEDYPIATNETKEGRAANRRVEIHRTDQ